MLCYNGLLGMETVMTDKCAYCETTEGLEWHHIWPLSLGGPDERYNMIRVCNVHHSILHEMSERTNISELTRQGMFKAQEDGTHLGRPLVIHPDILRDICADRASGMSYSKLTGKYSFPRNTIHKNVKKYAHDLASYEAEYASRQKQYAAA